MLTVTTELPFPDGTCGGLKLHELSAGKPEQATVTLLGKLPVFGLTATLNRAVCPRATDRVAGVVDIEKSKPAFGIAVKLKGTECAIWSASLPLALRLNE